MYDFKPIPKHLLSATNGQLYIRLLQPTHSVCQRLSDVPSLIPYETIFGFLSSQYHDQYLQVIPQHHKQKHAQSFMFLAADPTYGGGFDQKLNFLRLPFNNNGKTTWDGGFCLIKLPKDHLRDPLSLTCVNAKRSFAKHPSLSLQNHRKTMVMSPQQISKEELVNATCEAVLKKCFKGNQEKIFVESVGVQCEPQLYQKFTQISAEKPNVENLPGRTPCPEDEIASPSTLGSNNSCVHDDIPQDNVSSYVTLQTSNSAHPVCQASTSIFDEELVDKLGVTLLPSGRTIWRRLKSQPTERTSRIKERSLWKCNLNYSTTIRRRPSAPANTSRTIVLPHTRSANTRMLHPSPYPPPSRHRKLIKPPPPQRQQLPVASSKSKSVSPAPKSKPPRFQVTMSAVGDAPLQTRRERLHKELAEKRREETKRFATAVLAEMEVPLQKILLPPKRQLARQTSSLTSVVGTRGDAKPTTTRKGFFTVELKYRGNKANFGAAKLLKTNEVEEEIEDVHVSTPESINDINWSFN